MNILVVGAGSIGCLFGGFFSLADHDVTLLGRGAQIEAIRQKGLTLRAFDRERTTKPKAIKSVKTLGKKQFDLILLSTKAYDVGQAMKQVAEHFGPESVVALLQNGIGVEDEIKHVADGHRVVRVLTSRGANLERSGILRLNGTGPTVVGAIQRRVQSDALKLTRELNTIGFATKFTNSLQSAVWEKTLVNAAINPLGAILGIKNGTLLNSEHTISTMTETIHEGRLVCEKYSVVLQNDPVQTALTTAKETSHNINSMLQDLRNGRRTEIDYINGAIVRLGKRVGVPTPINHCLTTLVKSLEITPK
ncbi:MAG: ketopantoate reductase family protein [Candidatus Bathyarchaeia archaeon]